MGEATVKFPVKTLFIVITVLQVIGVILLILALVRRYRKMKDEIRFEVSKARRVRNVFSHRDLVERAVD
jgi:uncharacterized membrane protein YqiK